MLYTQYPLSLKSAKEQLNNLAANTAHLLPVNSKTHLPDTLIYVPIQPLTHCQYSECFLNCDTQVTRNGGEAIQGWLVRTFPRVLIELEAHAIWCPDNGQPVDITPQALPQKGGHEQHTALFFPDPTVADKDKPLSNILIPLDSSKKPLYQNYTKARQHLSDAIAAKDPQRINTWQKTTAILQRQVISEWKPRPNDPCTCGSRKKFKKCCG